ncbi:DNA-processing protein DprA [Paenibacillus humicola]|uniref:DNA-processing protein DprA n=1 Tax=Paenibacillus humicola TaxID=3110540 RepID=UPI00237AB571|nr:DNA-processing protein DprA [Paenibacillus humicola]
MYNEAKRTEALLTLHETPGIGWQTVRKAAEFGRWDAYGRFTPEAWVSSVGLKPEQAAAASRAFAGTDQALRSQKLASRGIRVLTVFDAEYPERLRQSPQPPWVLYTIGRTELLTRPSIAIVGTRGPTAYGRRIASHLARELSECGIVVVSGMARGIDSMAHEGALEGSGGTVAVLGTPVDVVYPRENRALYRSIAERGSGVVISEVPPGTPFHPGLFPLRNRIIAGLSLGTAVVEAAERSGSLITADQALEMGRDVFAVPGPVSSPKSAGTNSLIKQGAKLIASAADIMEEYSELLPKRRTAAAPGAFEGHSGAEPLTAEEAAVVAILQDGPLTIDELHERTSYPFGLLNAVLINLCIKQRVEQHPGSIYSAF